ncbi:lia operon protein LiaF [Paenibacillus sophorae]|uniref:Cell wall-active antibiotics response protein n=1 Tax=Paenibacillus sophorae TaxID=1333845 RepID=A0A1H8MDK4_9BACL|nr:cell wall-active antibiotics response protein LiaF [Paenibacillus sophorae]QWU17770.1 cell wall-active antibiotics response protein [Paenibacillus sophorae]SEO15403.1 lia operon protein LiaF [Paenibacillus sophorae]
MRRRIASQVFGGLILIGIGVLFLLRQLGYADIDIGYLFSNFWPVVLIIIGCQRLLGGGGRGFSSIGSLFFLALGVYFLGRNLGWFDLSAGDFFTMLIPVALIGGGLMVIFRPHRSGPPEPPPAPPKFYSGDKSGEDAEPPRPLESTLDDEFERKFGGPREESGSIESSAGKSGVTDWDREADSRWKENRDRHERRRQEREERHERRNSERWERYERKHGHFDGHEWSHSEGKETTNRSTFIGDIHMGREHFQLKNTNVSQFIGDTVLDLTNAQIPYGETKINLSAFIGDLKIYIPDDMDLGISVNSSSFIGDMEVLDHSRSGFMSSVQCKTPYYKEAGKKIRINVSAFIGDIKVKTVG